MKSPLHRQTKQQDAESLAQSLITCCAFSNSALTEDGICDGANEYYYRVVEQYINIDDTHDKPEDLERVAFILETLASQFRTAAENIKEEKNNGDDDDERQDRTKA